MALPRSIPALACIVALLLMAASPLWHDHDHAGHQTGGDELAHCERPEEQRADDEHAHNEHENRDHHDEEPACEVCHAVLHAGPRDLPAPTALFLHAPLAVVIELAQDEHPAVCFVRQATARGPPRLTAA
ncbi:MAG TPA: DUF2946 family protein [Phycisphaerales bacterium]|nr:DUF2946 family protein [Phycisphaerales bacterium]